MSSGAIRSGEMSSAKQVFDCVILFLLKRTNDQICAEYEFMPFN